MKRLAAVAVALLLCGCEGMQSSLDPAGDQAGAIRGVFDLMMWVCGFMYLLVVGFLAWALWRGRGRESFEPEATAHDRKLEGALAVWAGIIVVGLTVLITASFFVDRSLASTRNDPNALAVKVTAYQWWWRVEYHDGSTDQWFETANEIRLPAGRTARIQLASNDVIHSFWIPNLSGKIDLIPGRTNWIDITPRREGPYRGQCAEFCGFQHAHMALDVTVVSPAEFEAWRRRQLYEARKPTTPEQAMGKAIFENKPCAMCHRIDGAEAAGRTGPNLTHVASRRTIAAGTLPYSRGALAGWIADPQALKPGARMPAVPLTPQESNALLAYLDSLK